MHASPIEREQKTLAAKNKSRRQFRARVHTTLTDVPGRGGGSRKKEA